MPEYNDGLLGSLGGMLSGGLLLAAIASDKELQKKILIAVAGIFLVGAGIGFLLAYLVFYPPLLDSYNRTVAQITNNDTLACFDISTLPNTTGSKGDYVVVNKYKMTDACAGYEFNKNSDGNKPWMWE